MPIVNTNRGPVFRQPLYRPSQETIECLISIGAAVARDEEPADHLLQAVKGDGAINRMGPSSFERPERTEMTMTDWSDETLAHFTLGVSYAESHHKWSGGSAATAINLLRSLETRGYPIEKLDKMSAIIRAHGEKHNPYKPFGSRLTNFFTVSEYREYAASVAEHYEQRRIEQDKRTIDKAAEKARLIVMARLGHRDRNTDRREKIIKLLNGMTMPEQLRYMAEHPIYPPQFFPIRIAYAATEEDMVDLPDELAQELWRRIKRYRRGPWRKFKYAVASRVAKIAGM
jgi:hypothetical protein